MSQMTPKEATETLTRMLNMKNSGMTWRHIAGTLGLPNPQSAKKLAKEAARVSQNTLLKRSLELGES